MQKPAQWRFPHSSPADFFRERHEEVYSWALQVSNNDVHEAEDLVQDAFILLSQASISPENLRNVEGYIYAIIRNLHRSRYERNRRHIPLPILDYDCARLGLSVTDSSSLLIVADQLRRICHFACERKKTSRGGSVLILRFFHGYYPSEIASILVSSRESVEEHLRTIRKEARDFLATSTPVALVAVKTVADIVAPAGRTPASVTAKTLLDELRLSIFASCRSVCPESATLARHLRTDAISPLSVQLLEHIVSCATCLEEVNRLLDLPRLNTRNPSDSSGKESGSGFRVLRRGSSQRKRRGHSIAFDRLDRLAGEFFEHRPESLCIAVNGQPVALQPVTDAHSEITVRLQQSTGIDFIEVFSEQDVRLLMLPIQELPPNGPFEQSAITRLSEGRELKATFRYTSPWPSVHVSYCSDRVRDIAERRVPLSAVEAQQKRQMWQGWRLGWRWIGAVLSLLGMIVYVVQDSRYNTAEARTVVAQCTAWENAARHLTSNVVRQRFDFRERNSPRASREIVEVWRGSGHSRFARHLDNSGHALAATNEPPPELANAQVDQLWQFEPSAETFAAFTRPEERLRIHEYNTAKDVEAADITLTLDKDSHRPIAEVLRYHGREFEFIESSFDLVPIADSPFAMGTLRPMKSKRATADLPANAGPILPTGSELEFTELQARLALHALRADLQDGVRYQQNIDGVTIDMVVEAQESRNKTIAALKGIPFIKPRFRVVSELTAPSGAALASRTPLVEETRFQPLVEPYLKSQLGSAGAVNHVMTAAARASDELLHRCVALSQLSTRYPAATISSLSPEARVELLRLVQSHLVELEIERKNFRAMALDLIRPVASAVTETDAAPAADNWTASVTVLLNSVRTLHDISTSLFVETTQQPGDSLNNLAGRALSIEARLQSEIEQIRATLVAHIGNQLVTRN